MVLERYRGEQAVNVPNFVTGIRIIGGAHEAWRYRQTAQLWRLWSTGAFFSLDAVDGWLARRLQQTTQAGGDLDKVAEQITGGLLLAGGLRHGTADKAVLAAVAATNGSNVAATVVGLVRGTVPESVPDVNRTAQALMNYGVGFNMIGNHMCHDARSSNRRRIGQVLRLAGGASALVGTTVFGTVATARLWRTVLRPAPSDRGATGGTAPLFEEV